jgi:hypothetical protein
MSPVVRRVVALGLVLGALCVETSAAAKKSGGKKASRAAGSAQQQAGNLVMGASDGVQNCAGKALDRGANKVEVYTKVTINSKGQIVAITTTVTVDRVGFSENVKQCVDGLLQAIKFPPVPQAPLITIERSWTIATS